LYGDLRKGLRKNWLADRWISGVAALGGAAAGTAVGLAALSLGTLATLTGAGGAALLGGISLAWYRWMYRGALRKSSAELERLVAAVEGNLRAASVFGAPPPTDLPPARPSAGAGDEGFLGSIA
jgi:hypothetical protein